jgi:spore coat polysaccharide biosynthesis protein SpsF (cytidylyltransferase family)
MRVVGIVQARMGSARLPGKSLIEIGGVPLAAHPLRRLRLAQSLTEVVLATSDEPADDALAGLAEDEGVRCVRGSEQDVLSRFLLAARETEAEAVVRVTGDCPFIDPGLVDEVVAELMGNAAKCDYASNVLRRTYPRGLDVEALFTDTLERAGRLGRSPEAREHVTWHVYRERPDLYLLRSVELDGEDFSALDWSVDTEEGLERARELYAGVSEADPPPSWRTIARIASADSH